MTDKIEWPIGEPIETKREDVTGTVLHIDTEGNLSGFLTYTNSGANQACTWSPRGANICEIDLIPPKSKPRTIPVWVDWQGGSDPVSSELPPMARGGWHKHTITHPDDIPPPITRVDVAEAYGGLSYDAEHVDAIMALIESRQ